MNEPNILLGKKLDRIAWILTFLVLILVGVMRRVKIDLGIDFSFLPPFHAIFNTGVAISLIAALIFIKKKNVNAHQKAVNMAMVLSALFLICYVLYHFTTEETKYCQEGVSRTIYFLFLISHIVLAGVSLPFILFTYIRGYTGQYDKHRKLAKITYPMWLYVAITGPICYLMLAPCY